MRQQWHINNISQIINLQLSWFCNNCLLWLLLKDCHALFTVCHTPLALRLKRFITVSISKLCPEAVCTLVPTPNCRGQMSQMENDLGNNLTYFTADLCLQVWWMEQHPLSSKCASELVVHVNVLVETLYGSFVTQDMLSDYFTSSQKRDRIHSDWCDAD